MFLYVFIGHCKNSLVYTISVISVFVSDTYVCVNNVLYVYNCIHEKAIKPSCILYLVSWFFVAFLYPVLFMALPFAKNFPVIV